MRSTSSTRLTLAVWLSMFATIAVVSTAVSCLPGANSTGDDGDKCGVERWPVKTLSDADAPRVDLTPVAGDIDALRALAAPSSLPDR